MHDVAVFTKLNNACHSFSRDEYCSATIIKHIVSLTSWNVVKHQSYTGSNVTVRLPYMHACMFKDSLTISVYSIEMLFPTIGSIHALSFMGTSISIDAIYIKIIQLKEKTLFQTFFLYCVTV